MKIKLLKDIPGYKAGEIYESIDGAFPIPRSSTGHYYISGLIAEGFAEEVKDDIDIEEIRKQSSFFPNGWTQRQDNISTIEERFFRSYRIVKAVIEKLNEQNQDEQVKYELMVQKNPVDVAARDRGNKMYRCGILPMMTNTCASKLLKLCESELKVLFGVK